jgi:predicted GIY-YIG superfamily endonuclease
MTDRRFVYVLASESDAEQYYIGVTSNVTGRLTAHNAGDSPQTRKHGPWRLVVALAFATEERALQFERYLKSGPGRAFAKRHFN